MAGVLKRDGNRMAGAHGDAAAVYRRVPTLDPEDRCGVSIRLAAI